MIVLATWKNEEDQIKNEGARVVTTFLHYKSTGIFPANTAVQGWIWPKFKLSELFLPAKMKKILSKMMALEWS